jgi:hypothetical protein
MFKMKKSELKTLIKECLVEESNGNVDVLDIAIKSFNEVYQRFEGSGVNAEGELSNEGLGNEHADVVDRATQALSELLHLVD